MKKRLELAGLALTGFAITAQFILMLRNRVADIPETIVRFFSFFTILTNILVALYFTAMYFGPVKKPFSIFLKKGALTALTVFILLVGIVYQLVLRGVWEPTGLQLAVDELLHTIIPVYFLAYWFLYAKRTDGEVGSMLYWLIYPLSYFAFIIIRGYLSGFYPYPFVNVPEIGYGGLAVNFIIIFGTIISIMAILGYLVSKKRNIDL